MRHIASLQHPLVKHMVKLRQNRDYRYEHQSLMIEGVKLIKEVCAHSHLKTVAALDETLIPHGANADQILIVSEDVLYKISGVQSPEGIVAEIPMPQAASLSKAKYLIALDRIRDPGNLGTLLRTALALGWEGAYILNDSCDPFNEKALRAAKGATFRLPLAWGGIERLIEIIHANQLTPYIADLNGGDAAEIKQKKETLLIIGSEADGVSPELRMLGPPLTIPMTPLMESLNVSIAGGILMFLLGPKRIAPKSRISRGCLCPNDG